MSTPQAGGAGAFRWNAGGWFGSQLGGTLWLLVGAASLAPRAPLAAAAWAAAFTLANALGLALWGRRSRLGMYTAIQAFLTALGALALAALSVADWAGELSPLTGGSASPRLAAYGSLVVVPGLMLLFWLQERFMRQQAGPAQSPPPPA